MEQLATSPFRRVKYSLSAAWQNLLDDQRELNNHGIETVEIITKLAEPLSHGEKERLRELLFTESPLKTPSPHPELKTPDAPLKARGSPRSRERVIPFHLPDEEVIPHDQLEH